MRILHLYKDYAPVLGGIENHIKMLAEAQAAQEHAVTVLVTSRDRHTRVETINGVRVVFAARLATLASAPLSLELPRLLARERPDIAHLHFPYPVGEVANYFFGRAHATVLTYHSDIVRQRHLRVLYAPLMQRVLRRADAIVATSPNYVASSPVLAKWQDKCVVVPLGIDPAPFEAASAARASAHEQAHGGTGKLLFVGRLRYYKGLDYMLRALRELPGVSLTVVGSGPMEREWAALARALDVADRVKFAGEVPDAELPRYYASSDVFVLPASERSEAFGAVQLEAMAAGLPVISTALGTGVEWVNQNRVTGLVVPPRDPAALASAIRALLSDPAARERMGAAGQARVRGEFTVGRMVEGVMQVYRSALARKPLIKSPSRPPKA